MIEISIIKASEVLIPIVLDGVKLERTRNMASKLTFTVVKDKEVAFREGNAVSLKVDGKNVFYGYIFTKTRDKEHHIEVVAYDQLRYLKNKDTYIYTNKTASELMKMIAEDFKLKLGSLDDTKHKIAQRIEDNVELADMIQNALDLTQSNTNSMYVYYDDYGALTLKNSTALNSDLLIEPATAENFNYSSSIDGETYNKIKLVREDKEGAIREVFQATGDASEWGILQYFDKVDEEENGQAKANALLKQYNKVARTLSISGAFGDIAIRGGSTLPVKLDLGDINQTLYMVVEKVTHNFNGEAHTMDLDLKNALFGD